MSFLSATERNATLGRKKRRKASFCKTLLFHECNSLLTAYQHDFDLPGLWGDFYTAQKSFHLTGLVTATGVRGMLEGKDYRAIDTFFHFIVAFIDLIKEFNHNPVLKRIHTLYWDIVNQLLYFKATFGAGNSAEKELNETIWRLKTL